MIGFSAQNARGLSPKARIRLIHGIAALARLGRNYEDTTAVFDVYRHLNGSSFNRVVDEFSVSKIGGILLENPYYISDALSDVAALRKLNQDTLGYIYLCEIEACGLDVAGVQNAAFQTFDGPESWVTLAQDYPHFYNVFRMLNWTHDLFHTLTGYGRDPLGEVAIHKFMHAQGTGHANGWMANLGGISLLRTHRPHLISSVLTNAKRMGKFSQNLTSIDLIAFLDVSLSEVRAILNISPDPVYAESIKTCLASSAKVLERA